MNEERTQNRTEETQIPVQEITDDDIITTASPTPEQGYANATCPANPLDC